jgi:hypothetical protein
VDPAQTRACVPFDPITNQVNTTATKAIASIREKLGNSYLPLSVITNKNSSLLVRSS